MFSGQSRGALAGGKPRWLKAPMAPKKALSAAKAKKSSKDAPARAKPAEPLLPAEEQASSAIGAMRVRSPW